MSNFKSSNDAYEALSRESTEVRRSLLSHLRSKELLVGTSLAAES